jgi:NADH-quinone oxidoreductase subunit J
MVEWDLVAFAILSAVELMTSIFVITSKVLVRKAMWLAITLITVGAIYILLSSEFVALIQILVYAGAVPVLFLFGLMLTRRKIMDEGSE